MSKFVVKNGIMLLEGSAFSGSAWEINNVTVGVEVSIASYEVMTEEWIEQCAIISKGTFTWETAYDDTLGIDLSSTIGVTAELFFDSVDGLALSCQAVIESANISGPVDGYSTVTWTGQSDGIMIQS